MSITISGAFIVAVFLLVAILTFSTVLGTTTDQGNSLRESTDSRVGQVSGSLSIASSNATNSGDGTNVTISVDNTGAMSYASPSTMDLLTKYTNSTGDSVTKSLVYVCKQLCGNSGNPGDDEWTISAINPDSHNPKMWDPDETTTLDLRVVPPVKTGTSGTVVVVVPSGVSDTAYFNN